MGRLSSAMPSMLLGSCPTGGYCGGRWRKYHFRAHPNQQHTTVTDATAIAKVTQRRIEKVETLDRLSERRSGNWLSEIVRFWSVLREDFRLFNSSSTCEACRRISEGRIRGLKVHWNWRGSGASRILSSAEIVWFFSCT